MRGACATRSGSGLDLLQIEMLVREANRSYYTILVPKINQERCKCASHELISPLGYFHEMFLSLPSPLLILPLLFWMPSADWRGLLKIEILKRHVFCSEHSGED